MDSAMIMLDFAADFTNEGCYVESQELRPETTGQRIFWLRKFVKKLAQRDLAEQAEVARGYLSEVEADKKAPSLSLLLKVADALDTTTDFLLLRTDNPALPDDAEPTRLSEEAEQAARMIDDMYPYMRTQALGAVANIYAHYQEHAKRDKMIIELLNLIEMSNGPSYRRDLERRLGLAARLQNNGEPPLLGLGSEPT